MCRRLKALRGRVTAKRVKEMEIYMREKIDAEKASDILLSLPVPARTETVPLSCALGRVLAEDRYAAVPIPPFDRSPYDGFAFRGQDTAGATEQEPAELDISEEIPAGKLPRYEITRGKAAKILTGAPIPKGANATIKYEMTRFTQDKVWISSPVRQDTDIVKAGEDISQGSLIAGRGTVLTAPLMGLIATQGEKDVTVYKKPRIVIINTGTELTETGEPLRPGSIYNSSCYALSGYLREAGAEPVDGGIVDDDPDEIADRILDALNGADMVVTTGGASVGDYDYAPAASQRLGARILFRKVAMKPGGSIVASEKDGKLILGLSGNPGAAALGLFRISMPYIRKLCGRAELKPEPVDVILKHPVNKKSEVLRLLRGRLEIRDGQAFFAENPGQGSGTVSSLVSCDLIGEVPAGSPPLPAGVKIRAYKME
jgi:molybdopterin molybdotransferase